MLNDPLAHTLSVIMKADSMGRTECKIQPVSKLIKKVLTILNERLYLGSFEELTSARGGVLKVNLLNKINKCGVIKPRFSVTLSEYEKFEKRYLPAKGFGLLIVSTSKGIMTQDESKEKKIGGRLIAYCY